MQDTRSMLQFSKYKEKVQIIWRGYKSPVGWVQACLRRFTPSGSAPSPCQNPMLTREESVNSVLVYSSTDNFLLHCTINSITMSKSNAQSSRLSVLVYSGTVCSQLSFTMVCNHTIVTTPNSYNPTLTQHGWSSGALNLPNTYYVALGQFFVAKTFIPTTV